MKMMRNVLLINAHHKYDGASNGSLNKTLTNVIENEALQRGYEFCGAEALPSFSCLDVIKAPDIENDIKSLKDQLLKVLA